MTKILVWGQILALILAFAPKQSAAKTKTTGRAVGSISAAQEEPLSLSEMQRESRLVHAHELLGKYYKHSAVRAGESVKQINSKIYSWTKERLPKKYRSQYKKIAQTIIDEAMKREFDPVFLLSVIQNESSFNPSMLGSLDEIGLMQLRPATADWIAKKFSIKYKGAHALFDPCVNIKIGAAYMDYLRDQMPHAQLYISAYNMGKRNVERNLEENTWPKIYASHVMKYYVEFYESIKLTQHKKKTAV
jgi:soluble lytic murein transglycosylase